MDFLLLVLQNGVSHIKKDMFMQIFMIYIILVMICGLHVMGEFFIQIIQEIASIKNNTELPELIFGVLELDLKMEK